MPCRRRGDGSLGVAHNDDHERTVRGDPLAHGLTVRAGCHAGPHRRGGRPRLGGDARAVDEHRVLDGRAAGDRRVEPHEIALDGYPRRRRPRARPPQPAGARRRAPRRAARASGEGAVRRSPRPTIAAPSCTSRVSLYAGPAMVRPTGIPVSSIVPIGTVTVGRDAEVAGDEVAVGDPHAVAPRDVGRGGGSRRRRRDRRRTAWGRPRRRCPRRPSTPRSRRGGCAPGRGAPLRGSRRRASPAPTPGRG